MKKALLSNIKHFVDSNVRHRIERSSANSSHFIDEDLQLVERQFEDLRDFCVQAEKRISSLLLSLGSSASLGAYTQSLQASLTNLSALTSGQQCPLKSAECALNGALISARGGAYTPQKATNIDTSTTHQHAGSNTTTNSSQLLLSTHSNLQAIEQTSNNDPNNTTGNIHHHHPTATNRQHKKLPIVGFFKFLVKSQYKLKPNSLLSIALSHCAQLQTQLTRLHLSYEQTIETECLKPLRNILENDLPNIVKLRRNLVRAHAELESIRSKYNAANQKQQQFQTAHFTSNSYSVQQNTLHQANLQKLDQLRKEVDEAETRFEQAKDNYAIELYSFVCRETELVSVFVKFYQCQTEYQQQASQLISQSLPVLAHSLASTPRKVVFGTPLEEHLTCTRRPVSLIIEICVHMLYKYAVDEEGLFRIPGGSVKIKKLKHAINAWFVTFSTHSEHDESQSDKTSQSNLLAVYQLFRDILGQDRRTKSCLRDSESQQSKSSRPLSSDDTSTCQSNHSTRGDYGDSSALTIDVHAAAGLLKLYLRELPEPLLTFSLYQNWIDVSLKIKNDRENLSELKGVVDQLPKPYYDNLRLLIRFLHQLTCHSDTNKMTATNLAITMAPSLICPQPVNAQEPPPVATMVDNAQMSSIGISASLHALVVEKLIVYAQDLFPGPVQFSLPDIDFYSLKSKEYATDEDLKSSSPTGSSTASSSSFSSSASTSPTSDNRDAGSTENMLTDVTSTRSFRTTRPSSVYINQETANQKAPPVPPAPVYRSQRNPINKSIHNIPDKPTKPQAPLSPSPDDSHSTRNQPETRLVPARAQAGPQVASRKTTSRMITSSPVPVKRPTVPPPGRPSTSSTSAVDAEAAKVSAFIPETVSSNKQADNDDVCNDAPTMHAEFDDLRITDVDDVDVSVSTISPVVSIDDSVTEDESNYYDKNRSSSEFQVLESVSRADEASKSGQPNAPIKSNHHIMKESLENHDMAQSKQPMPPVMESAQVPVKPPRSTIPKVSQFTPL